MGTLDQYRDREHWSYSALNQYLNVCSLQYFFDRIAKLPKAFTPVSLSFGSAFHRATEWVHLTRKEGRIPNPKECGDLFADIWGRQLEEDKDIRFDEGQDAETCRIQGMDMVSGYVEQLDLNERVLAVNEAFAGCPAVAGLRRRAILSGLNASGHRRRRSRSSRRPAGERSGAR